MAPVPLTGAFAGASAKYEHPNEFAKKLRDVPVEDWGKRGFSQQIQAYDDKDKGKLYDKLEREIGVREKATTRFMDQIERSAENGSLSDSRYDKAAEIEPAEFAEIAKEHVNNAMKYQDDPTDENRDILTHQREALNQRLEEAKEGVLSRYKDAIYQQPEVTPDPALRSAAIMRPTENLTV